MPTGTGKTDLICLYLKRLIQAGRAERVLFLVDRDQLAKQALEAIQDILNQYSSYWLRPGMVRQEQQITVCLLQTMISRYHGIHQRLFRRGYCRRMPPLDLRRLADRADAFRRLPHRSHRHARGLHRAQHVPVLSVQGRAAGFFLPDPGGV